MSFKPNDTLTVEFDTCTSTGALTNADSLPVGILSQNGTDDGTVTVTVSNKSTGRYKAVCTIPVGYAAGDRITLHIAATISTIAAGDTFGPFVLDSKRWSDVIGAQIPTANAGASTGLLISGANTGPMSITGGVTFSNSGGDAFTLTSSGSNGSGLNASGNGTGHGVKSTGGATGRGIYALGGATSGAGIRAEAQGGTSHGFHGLGFGAGSAFLLDAGATGVGITINGGGTSGAGLSISTTSGDGISVTPTAGNALILTANGTSKHGAVITGGTAGTSDGIKAVAGTGGVDVRGNITGSLSGSAGSVTAAVTLAGTQSFNNSGQTTKLVATLDAADVTGNLHADLQTIKAQAVTATAGFSYDAQTAAQTTISTLNTAVGNIASGATVVRANDASGVAVATASAFTTFRSSYTDALATQIASNLNATVSSRQPSGNVTLGGYATGQDPATLLLASPANKLATDGSGRVTVGGFAAGALTASGIASGALSGKGDWLLAGNYTAPDNTTIGAISTAFGTFRLSYTDPLATQIVSNLNATVSSRLPSTSYTAPPTAAQIATTLLTDTNSGDLSTVGSLGYIVGHSPVWYSGSGSGLTGPSAITLMFHDANGAPVRNVEFTVIGQGVGPRSASDGTASFGLSDGTYTIAAGGIAGLLFPTTTLIVSGATTRTITGTAVSITPSTVPGTVTAYVYVYSTDTGAPAANVTAYVDLVSSSVPGVIVKRTVSATSDVNGLAQFPNLLRDSVWSLRGAQGGGQEFTTPTTGTTYQIPGTLYV